jgi:ABC-2 type transport system ATP-binding protein
LLQIPGVTDAKPDRKAMEIHAREAEPVVRALLTRDPSLSGLEITSAGLEEAFLALTQYNAENTNRQN